MTEHRPEQTYAGNALALEHFAELNALLALVSEIAGALPPLPADLDDFAARYAGLPPIARNRFDAEARMAAEFAASGIGVLLANGPQAPGRAAAAAELARALALSLRRMSAQLD